MWSWSSFSNPRFCSDSRSEDWLSLYIVEDNTTIQIAVPARWSIIVGSMPRLPSHRRTMWLASSGPSLGDHAPSTPRIPGWWSPSMALHQHSAMRFSIRSLDICSKSVLVVYSEKKVWLVSRVGIQCLIPASIAAWNLIALS